MAATRASQRHRGAAFGAKTRAVGSIVIAIRATHRRMRADEAFRTARRASQIMGGQPRGQSRLPAFAQSVIGLKNEKAARELPPPSYVTAIQVKKLIRPIS